MPTLPASAADAGSIGHFMFEHFDHTADLGLRVKAATLAELLAEAGRGLLAMLVANPDAVRGVQSRTIELSAAEPAYAMRLPSITTAARSMGGRPVESTSRPPRKTSFFMSYLFDKNTFV